MIISFVRNEEDQKIDISLLGIIYPFGMFNYDEKKCAKYNRKNKYEYKNLYWWICKI